MSEGPRPLADGDRIHEPFVSLDEIDRYSAEAAPFKALAAKVMDMPPDLLERAFVVAASLPRSGSSRKHEA
jgi:hypothetical protein